MTSLAGAPIAADDIARWRSDTPGCLRRHHLNNAGSALPPRLVTETIQAHLALEAEIGGYEAAAAARGPLDEGYRTLAALIKAQPRNIAVASSATAAYAQALGAFDFARGDVIVTTAADYLSNRLMFEALASRAGVRVVEAPDLPEGGVDPAGVRALIASERPRLVALTWIPTFSGMVQRAAEVGAECAAAGVPYLIDGCQAVGQLDIDVNALKCDFLAATARKFLRGPRGIGFLYVSEAALRRGAHPLLVDMRGATWPAPGGYALYDGARRFEQWEQPLALVLGMAAAARYAMAAGVARTSARAHSLAADARERLGAVPGIRTLDRGERLSAIATFECADVEADTLVRALRERGVNASAQGRDENAVALGRLGARSLLRVSPHYYNDASDLDAVERALRELLSDRMFS